MNLALHLAKKSYKLSEIPVGAVVVLHGKVIGYGYNLKETLKDATQHAEIRALKMAAKTTGTYHLEGATMYTTLEPCAMCAGAIINFRLEKVYIATENKRFGCCGSKINLLDYGFNHTCQVEFGLLKDQASKLISDFFAEIRKQFYI